MIFQIRPGFLISRMTFGFRLFEGFLRSEVIPEQVEGVGVGDALLGRVEEAAPAGIGRILFALLAVIDFGIDDRPGPHFRAAAPKVLVDAFVVLVTPPLAAEGPLAAEDADAAAERHLPHRAAAVGARGRLVAKASAPAERPTARTRRARGGGPPPGTPSAR